jgi:hypothetical protein
MELLALGARTAHFILVTSRNDVTGSRWTVNRLVLSSNIVVWSARNSCWTPAAHPAFRPRDWACVKLPRPVANLNGAGTSVRDMGSKVFNVGLDFKGWIDADRILGCPRATHQKLQEAEN